MSRGPKPRYAPLERGQRFGRWIVLVRVSPRHVEVRCDCGREQITNESNLRNGLSTGCVRCAKRKYKLGDEVNGRFIVALSPACVQCLLCGRVAQADSASKHGCTCQRKRVRRTDTLRAIGARCGISREMVRLRRAAGWSNKRILAHYGADKQNVMTAFHVEHLSRTSPNGENDNGKRQEQKQDQRR